MRDVVSESTARGGFDIWLMTTFGFCALLLAAVGVYGLISYSVERRTREIGIRLALGARPRQVWQMIVQQAMALVIGGVIIGLAASFYLVRVLASMLFGVSGRDPVTFAAVPLLLIVVALIAICVPARRATRISPMSALRYE